MNVRVCVCVCTRRRRREGFPRGGYLATPRPRRFFSPDGYDLILFLSPVLIPAPPPPPPLPPPKVFSPSRRRRAYGIYAFLLFRGRPLRANICRRSCAQGVRRRRVDRFTSRNHPVNVFAWQCRNLSVDSFIYR